MPQRHAFFSNYFCCLINFDYLLCCFFFSFVAPKLSKWLFYAFQYCNRFVSFSLEVIFIPVHQRMVKVRPTSPSFVLVWNTPEAYNGTHILKSIAKILKEYNGKPARFVKKKCYEREPGTVKNLLCPVVRTPVSANHAGLNFNPSFFSFLSKALSPDNFLYSFKSIQSSNCRQRELNWICFLSSHIWVQISHKPWVILTQLRKTRPWTIWTGIHQSWDTKLHDLPPCTK